MEQDFQAKRSEAVVLSSKRLEAIGPEIWGAEFDLWLHGWIHFRGRMTVIRLADGRLWLHSPIPIDDALAAEIAALGEVAYLVAPNCFHHLHLAKAQALYPHALAFAVEGLKKKRKDLTFHAFLGPNAPDEWKGEIEQVPIEGMPAMQEVAFFHPKSQSLIVTDLVFHVHEAQGFFAPLIFRLVGAYRKLAMSRLGRTLIKDRAAFQRSLTSLFQWPFQRLIMAHGRIIHQDAKPLLQSVFGGPCPPTPHKGRVAP